MAVGHEPIFPQIPDGAGVIITPTDTTNKKVLYTAGTSGAIISGVSATSTDSADKTLSVWIYDGVSVYYQIGEVLVVDGAGTNGVDKAKSVLNLTDLPFLPNDGTLTLKPGYSLVVSAKATITTDKAIHVYAFVGDYDGA